MKAATPSPCAAIESHLIAAATGEASRPIVAQVERHLRACGSCREEFAAYQGVDAAIGKLRDGATADLAGARRRVLARLADLRSRLVRYGVFESPLGPVLLATTESGIALVEYLDRVRAAGSWLLRQNAIEPYADQAELADVHGELLDYLAGRRRTLDWALDYRFASSDFQRAVLAATAAVPYGAVSSYAGIARDIGRPAAVRAVAQALRHNPLPIVVPCHRIIGSNGSLVGYSGKRIGLKEQLLGLEGVRTAPRRGDLHIDRNTMYAWDHRCHQYCLPTCGEIPKLPIGAITLIASPREAESLGLTPCGDCRPDENPLPVIPTPSGREPR